MKPTILLAVLALFIAALQGCTQIGNAHSNDTLSARDGVCEIMYRDVRVTSSVVIDPHALAPDVRALRLPFAAGGVLIRHSNNDVIYVSERDEVIPVTPNLHPDFIERITLSERDTAKAARERCAPHMQGPEKTEIIPGLF